MLNEPQFYPIDREAIGRLLSICERLHFEPKQVVMRPGEEGHSLLYVIDGSLSVSTEGEDGRELILSYLNPGDFLGELGLFMKPREREVMVRTRSICQLAEISYDRLREALDKELSDCAVEIMTAIGSKLSQRLLQARRKVLQLAFLDTQGRVAKALIDLCDEPDAVSHPEGTMIRITRQELSRIVGCSREMAGRVMKALEEDGMLKASGKTVVVLGKYKGAAIS
ncbi:cyclic nucleotide-binding domain-containing protein [Wenzhouxiangella limi]|uniref:cyclic nucleotide-binding domain-containing protein n=1 Tax=Wenzhouxiangella limi TaxID=2707351 RepID=UPI001942AC52|nr:cyclic nucleotide-binding domain-containing protein [Wenzhouxiangella limi]